jgi:PilZ domain
MTFPTIEEIRFSKGSAVPPADRRDFPRYPIPNRLTVDLRVLPATEVITAQIQDLSREGVGLLTQVFIAPGESVTFPVGEDWVVAEVRHCEPTEGGYAIGAYITDIIDRKDLGASK